MNKWTVCGAVIAGVMLSAMPLSFRQPVASASFVQIASATAAELSVPDRSYRIFRKHRLRFARYSILYHPVCGGPYVGAGINGGSYVGGPWIDLRC